MAGLALLAGVSGCAPESAPPAASGLTAAKAGLSNPPTGAIPADAHLKGLWSPVMDWPLMAIHAVTLPDGRVLSYGTNTAGQATGKFVYDLWTPSAGFGAQAHATLPNGPGTDLFCSAQILLPADGGVLIGGGDTFVNFGTTNTGNNNSNLFSLQTDQLTRGPDMNRGRWYATETMLLNGEVYVQGGTSGEDHPEIRGLDGRFRLLDTVDTSSFRYYYPRNFVVLDGRIFGFDTAGKMYWLDPRGAGTLTRAGDYDGAFHGDDTSAAMFAPGRILQFGGNSNGALLIDVTSGTPRLTTSQPLSSQRRLVTATLLPNGRVLATGGSERYNELFNVNNNAEIWNPETGRWSLGSAGALARLYHSSAILLPDATVLVGGGGQPGPLQNLNVELYYPPYLFAPGGQLAARPGITEAPGTLAVGRSFALRYADAPAIARVVLVKNSAMTHGINMDQRFVELTFRAAGNELTVNMPSRPSDTPPGQYLLFVLNAQGVPSVAKQVWLNVAGAPDAQAPSLVNPGDQTHVAGQALALDLAASDPDGDALHYSAAGLPPGLRINPDSGRLAGTPDAPGSYNVVLGVDDGAGHTASARLTWTITGDAPLRLDPLQPPTPVVAGSSVSYTAHADGGAAQYQWHFGDGTPGTAFSASAEVTHAYTRPGAYFVTVTARDERGVDTHQTFLQIVHLPLTERRPTQSTSVTYEPPRTGAPSRLWVANPDADTVSVFSADTGARQAEIAVGDSPRALAFDAAGRLWVSNKQGGSLSIIDPQTLSVIRTLVMPRASQPHGLVMSPTGEFAYVVLEATGQLLRYRTANYKRLAVLHVGPNPRHLSVGAAGSFVYVSRFLSPPQPGEDTASVQSTRNGAATGGEVLRVRAGNMTVDGVIVLAHSTRVDGEIQGRGLPNYLGAMAISPDGTQAYVPGKQDNLRRGALRDGKPLNFQNTVRAISSRIDLKTGRESAALRIDHDNASLASAAVFDPTGVFLFVALETSREVALISAHNQQQLLRLDVGLAPQGLAISPDGSTLAVSNFMDRTVTRYDLRPLLQAGELRLPYIDTQAAVAQETLAPAELRGKQLFYDARDSRLALDRYMSCASCHEDGGSDGRTWDFTGFGEGLRNTPRLRGRAGGQGFLHWSNNFDEVQDFETQIRALAGGSGLLSNAQLNTGTRAQPLGDKKAGLSADLDALAAYLGSLGSFDFSPFRPSARTLGSEAGEGRLRFNELGCSSCHSGEAYTGSGANTLVDVGTLKPASGQRLGGALTGIDVPTLRDVWASAPYLHDGSAPTLADAVRAHRGIQVSEADMPLLVAFLKALGREEPAPLVPAGSGRGIRGTYYNNLELAAPIALRRVDEIDLQWPDSPGPGVNADNYSVRWAGFVTAPATGSYRFQTSAVGGLRLRVGSTALIDQWPLRGASTDTSATVNLQAGQKVALQLDYRSGTGAAGVVLRWQTPGNSGFEVIPRRRLSVE